MSVFDLPEFDDHQLVQFVCDQESGLKAIIALHRTHRRAAGGIRMKPYASSEDALRDALRLSRAMSYKWAFADFKSCGGKTVVIADPEHEKTPALLHALGTAIEALGGRYYAGSDVGTGAEDMRTIQEATQYVRGADPDHGDSSAATAYGVFQGLRAAVKQVFDRDDLEGMRVAVQGVGHVGSSLCDLLAGAGAKLIVADPNQAAAAAMRDRHQAQVIEPDEILYADTDVLSPCALGAIITEANAERIQAKVICGAANNQLATDAVAPKLHARRVLFVPDYTVNSGGIINGAAEGPSYDRAAVWARLDRIYDQCVEVFELARRQDISSLEAANAIAERKMQAMCEKP